MATRDKIIEWPDWMPRMQISGYGYEPLDRRTRTDMEVGSILRVNFDSDETSVACTLVCNSLQAAWFEAFERDVLAQGSRWFRVPLQSGGSIQWHTARLAARPKAQQLLGVFHTAYHLQLDLERRELELCGDLVALLACLAPDDILAIQDAGEMFMSGFARMKAPNFWLYGCAQRRAYDYGL